MSQYQFGVVGLAVMGRGLALNPGRARFFRGRV